MNRTKIGLPCWRVGGPWRALREARSFVSRQGYARHRRSSGIGARPGPQDRGEGRIVVICSTRRRTKSAAHVEELEARGARGCWGVDADLIGARAGVEPDSVELVVFS